MLATKSVDKQAGNPQTRCNKKIEDKEYICRYKLDKYCK